MARLAGKVAFITGAAKSLFVPLAMAVVFAMLDPFEQRQDASLGAGAIAGASAAARHFDDARALLQVKVDHGDDADDLFTKLMGDIVEPRREFIQENALDADVDA